MDSLDSSFENTTIRKLLLQLGTSSSYLEDILLAVADGITVQDQSGNVIFANEAAAKMMGFETVAELVNTPAAEIIKNFQIFDEAGVPFPVYELPGRKA